MSLPNLKTIYGKMVFKKEEIGQTATSIPVSGSSDTITDGSSTGQTGPAVLKDPITEMFYVYKINQTYSIDTLDPNNIKLAKNPTFNVLGLVVKTENNSTFYFQLEGLISDETTDKYINGSDDVLKAIHQLYTGEYEKLLDKNEFDDKYLRPQLNVTMDGIEGIEEEVVGMYGGGEDKIDFYPLLTIYNSPNAVKHREYIEAQSSPDNDETTSSTMDTIQNEIYGKIYLQLKTLQPEKVIHITDYGEEEQDIKNL